MEEDILNYLYQLSCFVGHPAAAISICLSQIEGLIGLNQRIYVLNVQEII